MSDPASVSVVTPHPFVFLAMPHSGAIHPGAARAMRPNADFPVTATYCQGSILCEVFNTLWCAALNERSRMPITHFAMLHSDVAPAMDWLEVLVAEQIRTGADVVSAVVPIKTTEGFVSTAIDAPRLCGDAYAMERRLTLSEVWSLPETFSAADCGFPDRDLLVNTGCWVCDFTKPWVEQIEFETFTRIERDAAGMFVHKYMPEDYLFSRRVQQLGGKVLATRKVALEHYGLSPAPNTMPWGSARTDEGKGPLVRPRDLWKTLNWHR